jgi:hypothetical protein
MTDEDAMDRSNHYEAAFEAYLSWHQLCYIAVDESRRTFLGETRVKNLDFIVHGDDSSVLLVDVKGRRFPSGPSEHPRRVWECWATGEDIDGLLRWQELFGERFRAVLVFTYLLDPTFELPAETNDLWTWRGRRYLLRAVTADAYRVHMRTRSPKWATVDLPGAVFRQLARPFHAFTEGSRVGASDALG